MKKTTYIKIFAAVIIALFGFLVFSFQERAPSAANNAPSAKKSAENIPKGANAEAQSEISPSTQKTEQKIAPKEEKRAETITLIAGSASISLAITPGQSLYDALRAPENSGKIFFAGKEYPGLGFFATDMGELHQGEGKNLLYYINGQTAPYGISLYLPKAGDVVEWKLE